MGKEKERLKNLSSHHLHRERVRPLAAAQRHRQRPRLGQPPPGDGRGGPGGGQIYGKFPSLQLAGPDDAGNRGVRIPSTSLDQYGATLARWFGVGPVEMVKVFPNLGNFALAELGFLG